VERRAGSAATGDDWTVVEQPTGCPAVPGVMDGQVHFTRPVAHQLTATATSTTGGLLVFNESHDPGWRATLDGQPAPVLRVNAVCQGVLVPPGEHEILFRYSPPGFRTGTAISAFGLLVLTGALAAARRTNHQAPSKSRSRRPVMP
jgi:uncharacterized membrane protein YfhO